MNSENIVPPTPTAPKTTAEIIHEHHVEIGRLGGLKRTENTTCQRLSEIGRIGGKAKAANRKAKFQEKVQKALTAKPQEATE